MPREPGTTPPKARIRVAVIEAEGLPEDIGAALTALLGQPACHCDEGETCWWPKCQQTGKGVGHHP